MEPRMQSKTDASLDPKLFHELNHPRIPEAAHADILEGTVTICHGSITFGAWSFPATPAYLIEIFNLVDRHSEQKANACFQGALTYLRGRAGCTAEQLQQLASHFRFQAPVLNLLPFRYHITW